MKNKNSNRFVTPFRAERRMVSIVRQEVEGHLVVVPELKSKERPVRQSKLFQRNWMKHFDRAKEGREDE